MKTKEQVYILVDKPKKAKKLKNVLDVFNEPIYRYTNKRLSKSEVSEHYPIIHFSDGEWIGYGAKSHLAKTEVSIKELKSILAKEHLKEGDYVIATIGKEKIIAIYNQPCDDDIALFESKKWYRVSDGYLWDNKGYFDNFKRYATPEEIAFLEGNNDKFAELKEAHRNGAVIECLQIDGTWFEIENPKWNPKYEYRIKPEENPQPGDVCKFWDDDEDIFAVAQYEELRIDDDYKEYIHGLRIKKGHVRYFKNCTKLTKQQLLDLFPNIE